MRLFLITACTLVVALVALTTLGLWRYRQAFPRPSSEVVLLTPDKRAALDRLRVEAKFGPHNFPPLGYTGAATPEDRARATAAVNDMIDGVLSHADGPLKAKLVSRLIAKALRQVDLLETEDRDRAADYMLEAWYLLGFKGATGRFSHGAAFPRPTGYIEPLPSGWQNPNQPRPID